MQLINVKRQIPGIGKPASFDISVDRRNDRIIEPSLVPAVTAHVEQQRHEFSGRRIQPERNVVRILVLGAIDMGFT